MNFKFNIHPCMYTFSDIKDECNSGFNLLVHCTISTIIQNTICTFFNVQGECKDAGFNLHVRGDNAESAGLEPPCLLGRNRPLHNRKASFK